MEGQINKCDTSHMQNERQKSHDHINRCSKAFDKVQHPFIIKLQQEGAHLNIIKAIYKNPTANIILNGQTLNMSLLRSGTIQGCVLSHTDST